MLTCPWNFLDDKQKHIISLVGGGGKTTIMYELAKYFARQQRKVVVLTTTHIWLPKAQDGTTTVAQEYVGTLQELEHLWQQGCYGVIGSLEAGTGKLIAPAQELLDAALQACDVALIEADGAKQMPCKLPAEHEPVLLKDSDIVIAVAGLDALGKSLAEGCFRWQLGRELFASSCDLLLDEAKLAQILLSEQGSRKAVGSRAFYIALNKCDVVEQAQAEGLRELLVAQGMAHDRIWLRNIAPARN
ncbi:MAG: selenium cofactor biosynthesis protein YqeC [Phascolarctobacterium sp.]